MRCEGEDRPRGRAKGVLEVCQGYTLVVMGLFVLSMANGNDGQ